MKNYELKLLFRKKMILSSSLILFFLTLSFCQLFAQNTDSNTSVLEAHDLLKNGQKEDAIKMLEAILEKDPGNAMAYYELSRSSESEKINFLEKAVEKDAENPMYLFELANAYMMQAYIAMQQGNEDAIDKPLKQCTESLKKVLAIKADCKESLLFLLELNVMLDDIGSKEEAGKYLDQLKRVDKVYAAHGEFILSGPDINAYDFWQLFMEKNGRTPDLLTRQGLAVLNEGNTEKAKDIFEEALNLDPDRNVLYLQLARGHLYKAMRATPETRQKEIDQIKKYMGQYLEKETNKAKSIEAWCYGWLAMLEKKSGNETLGQSYLEKANKIDPNFSRATALPTLTMLHSPDEISYHYKSYFAPF